MECGSAASAPGLDPQTLDPWQSDGSFSLAAWEKPGQEPPPELDTSRDSSQADALDRSSDFHTLEFSNQGKLRDNAGLVSGTVSPMTLPSSTDDNLHHEEPWTQFQMPDPMAVGMPLDAPLFYPYAKGPTTSTNTVILDDSGDLQHGQEYSDLPSDQVASFQRLSGAFPCSNGSWTDALNSPATHAPSQFPVSLPLESPLENGGVPVSNDFPGSGWFEGLDMHISSNLTSPFPVVSPDGGLGEDFQQKHGGSQNESESPKDVSGAFDASYSAANDSLPTFVEQQFKDDSQYMEWNETSPEDGLSNGSQMPKTGAFIVNQGLPNSPSVTLPTAMTVARHTPIPLQPAAAARKRKQRNSPIAVEQPPQPRPLRIVQEDGQGGSISSEDFVSPPRGARRKGPLSVIGRANAGLRRKNKDTCVQCRMNKRKCDGNSPCEACRPTLHEQPCARACFANIVEYGTCNYISQRAINHPTLDGTSRVRMEIPSEFDLSDLLAFLSERRGKFNIRASQAWGSLYVLDLAETYKFLRGLSEYNGNSQSTFLEFIDRRLVESKDRSKNWLSCVRDCDPMSNLFALLSQWNNMPSRASYSFVPVGPDGQERPMDVNNPDDRKEILLAAQLSRIFCRMLEVEGFRKLERDFYNIKWKRISHEAHLRFLNELGRILLSLRWRVSWWKRLGDGGAEPDPSKQHYVDRVELLCRILHVYYTSVLSKLRSWSSSDVPKGIWSTYADSEKPVWDDFPVDPTDSGFQKWMERGKDLIEQAGVPNRVAKF